MGGGFEMIGGEVYGGKGVVGSSDGKQVVDAVGESLGIESLKHWSFCAVAQESLQDAPGGCLKPYGGAS